MNRLRLSGISALLAFAVLLLYSVNTKLPIPNEQTSELPDGHKASLPVTSSVDSTSQAPDASNAGSQVPGAFSAQVSSAGTSTSSKAAASTETVKRIYLDPGHQRKGNAELEPVGPDIDDSKPKVTGGTKGVSTGKPEYVLNLEVALRLKQVLQAKGYEVLMSREDHEVDLSNKQRAELANAADASLVVRIHADGAASPKARGISVLYPDASVPSTEAIQPASQQAAERILEELIISTGAPSRGALPRKDLTGFNWSKVPVVLVEMGFMTHPAEDKLLSDEDYQQQLADGMASGIESFQKQLRGE
jgi:N-acetylmuramoyl-L-alanine amidase